MSSISKVSEHFETLVPQKIMMIAGSLIGITGLFITLAAFQIVPPGVNAISQLFHIGQGLGYGFIVGGFGLLGGGIISYAYFQKKENTSTLDSNSTAAQPVKNVFKVLFEEDNEFCQNIPIYRGILPPFEWLTARDIQEELLTQSIVRSSIDHPYPFIAIKLKCVNTAEELLTKDFLVKSTYQMTWTQEADLVKQISSDIDDPILMLLVVHDGHLKVQDNLFFRGKVPLMRTSFVRGFRGDFGRYEGLADSAQEDERIEAEKQGLILLKELIKNGKVTDLYNVQWQLCA